MSMALPILKSRFMLGTLISIRSFHSARSDLREECLSPRMVQSSRFTITLLLLTLAAGTLFAQNKKQRLYIEGDHGTARATGHIGGEAHDLYTINIPAGKTMVVRVVSKANRAEFYITNSTEPQSEPVSFGAMNEKLRTWMGTVPATADYSIVVNA